jgi:hypothetical protein
LRYKNTILKAVRAGDSAEIARLTTKFNETIGGKCVYVRVQRPKPGESDKWEMLLDKYFSDKRPKLPAVNYPALGKPHVSFWDGFVLILPARLGGGKYEDDVYITMAVEPIISAAGTQPAASGPARGVLTVGLAPARPKVRFGDGLKIEVTLTDNGSKPIPIPFGSLRLAPKGWDAIGSGGTGPAFPRTHSAGRA